eukprot:TRINITY_DN3372_c0_g1_i1.p1 TRINITY_DN3372_c0_g1~~TRINITY_DN3372_c0_g1_i1.p1  ORF type:complete len:239 (+),score=70.83 TRINITY_DN3372_c0_g1_i1:192-908(+)
MSVWHLLLLIGGLLCGSASTDPTTPPTEAIKTTTERSTEGPTTLNISSTSSSPLEITTISLNSLKTTTTTTTPNNTPEPTTTAVSEAETTTKVPLSSTTPVILPLSESSSTASTSTHPRSHHGKKELDEEFPPSTTTSPSSTIKASTAPPYHDPSYSSPVKTVNYQFVEEPVPIQDEVLQTPSSNTTNKSSLYAGLVLGSILSMALGFLIYKRIDSARRRREYRRMNDYLIDGMYNDI